MSDDMARLRDEVAGVLAEPLCQRICDMAGEPRLFVPGEVEAMLRETADALLPLLARVRDDARCPLAEHEADVTSYDAGDIHGCECGWALTSEQQRSEDYGWGEIESGPTFPIRPSIVAALVRDRADTIATTEEP